jgi:hypothetical protein
MDEFQYTVAAERFRHFLAERRPSFCQGGRVPPQCALVEADVPLKRFFASVRHPMRGQEIQLRASTARFSSPSTPRFDPAALIQSP